MADQFVYVHHEEHVWVPARLVQQTATTATVVVPKVFPPQPVLPGLWQALSALTSATETKKIFLKDYPQQALPLQNVGVDGMVVDDMIGLPFLHEAGILYHLKQRHGKGIVYTRTGEILVAVNPYQWFPHLYQDKTRNRYSQQLIWSESRKDEEESSLRPHVYETSALAFRGLWKDRVPQSLLVSGESGAGKTETVKICLNHLARAASQHNHIVDKKGKRKTVDNNNDVIKKVLDSNPLLEAFGNAQTRRNDNSSRFGKYIELQFRRTTTSTGRNDLEVAGSVCQVYLLEKSRVVHHDPEERTFHIFYQLLSSPDSLKASFWKGLKSKSLESFAYVGSCQATSIEGKSDAEHFQHTLDSLAVIGLTSENPLLSEFMQALCAVLLIGNVGFLAKDDDHAELAGNESDLKKLCQLLKLSREAITEAMLFRQVKVRNELHRVPLNAETARESMDALAKQIYERVFLWLVRVINEATTAEGDIETIGLLDIFGFESFPVNSFEQLLINFANERLQHKFTEDVFTSVLEEYKAEGLALEDISYNDNDHVLSLIEGKMGLLAMLNEEAIRPNGSDMGFVNKALHANKTSTALIIPRVKSDTEFGIKHYAGDVMYDAMGFVTKNQDNIPADLVAVVQTCSNSIIAEELAEAVAASSPHKKPKRMASNLAAPTAWTKYKKQLSNLMSHLQKTRSRYIRCIKPNSIKKPKIMEHGMTLEQLRSSGVISAVTLARSAFPNRMKHLAVLERFYMLWTRQRDRPNLEDIEDDPEECQECCEKLLQGLLIGDDGDGQEMKMYAVGKTRVYFRGGALETLEAERLRSLEPPAIEIQRIARGYIARQFVWRLQHKTEVELRERMAVAALVVQCAWRCKLARKAARKAKKARKKRLKEARLWRAQSKAATTIQCMVRVVLAKKERERRYVKAIKDRAKKLKKAKKKQKQSRAATTIQRVSRGWLLRSKYSEVLKALAEKKSLRQQLEKLKKKSAKIEKTKTKQLREIAEGKAGKSLNLADPEVKRKLVVVGQLQDDHRELQTKQKTIDGMIAIRSKNFETIMKENQELRKDYDEVDGKNEKLRQQNKKLLEERQAAEKRIEEIQAELKNLSTKYVDPIATGRQDFEIALRRIISIMGKRCKDKKLVADLEVIAMQCQIESKGLEAQAHSAHEARIELSPDKDRRSLIASPSKAKKVIRSPR